MAAGRLLHRRVLATDVEPWAVRVTRRNAALNRMGPWLMVWLADGWRDRRVRAHGPYDLVFANILARPLCLMARQLSVNLAPGGTAILSGLLASQVRTVLVSHLRCGLRLEARVQEPPWVTLIVRRPARTTPQTTQ
jgi:ribosomal protein L11 methyltransferase